MDFLDYPFEKITFLLWQSFTLSFCNGKILLHVNIRTWGQVI